MSITMHEIDALRLVADNTTEALRQIEKGADSCPECEAGTAVWCQDDIIEAREEKARAERAVVAALAQWWAQGCREVTS